MVAKTVETMEIKKVENQVVNSVVRLVVLMAVQMVVEKGNWLVSSKVVKMDM